MRRIRLAVLLLCLSVVVPAFAQSPAIGDPAPTVLGKGRDGKIVDLAEHRGKVVIVTFWASWCGYCLKELPVLDALQKKVDPQWLQVIAVNVEDPPATYRQMMRQMRDYSLLQSRDANGDIARTYSVKAYPNLWVIDTQGRIASHHVGYGEDSLESIVGEIKRVLTEEMHRQQAAAAAAKSAS
ncbi:TlpA disulfide reductase family protein [Pseudoxanthomonas sp. z9]|uniref:TlpA family protein disulfide reductase n=1 Tax=Pseudoxanthomonas sp. z9 TaxID=2584942 RepID=UPI0015E87CBE|nr:TlpA disulfide reductase family protein [Pseudoxanthomonas sp. z9]